MCVSLKLVCHFDLPWCDSRTKPLYRLVNPTSNDYRLTTTVRGLIHLPYVTHLGIEPSRMVSAYLLPISFRVFPNRSALIRVVLLDSMGHDEQFILVGHAQDPM